MLPSLVVPAQSICRRNGRDTFERIILCPEDETWKISNLQRAKEYGAPVLFMYKGGCYRCIHTQNGVGGSYSLLSSLRGFSRYLSFE